jgi:hypothetical protein
MNNSQQSVIEALELVRQLTEKTIEKKIAWNTAIASPDEFSVTIGNGFRFTVYSLEGGGIGISMQQAGHPNLMGLVDLLRAEVEANPRYGYSVSGEQELFSALATLHELSRRSALDVDKRVAEVRGLLDSL